ncbi:MAG: tetratricopeptide repeat protein [Scytonematopsis contorta HA4267-MV1]|jgi:tetratricopeptide (TPR) repeat protein|nr:tetratricopeptide repeat protein [Scytonematopsis contorta HA4267-MV1]
MKNVIRCLSVSAITINAVLFQYKVLAGSNYRVSLQLKRADSALIAQQESRFDLKDFNFWSRQCLSLSQVKEYTQALAACEQGISLKPNDKNTELWFARSQALFHLGKYKESQASWERVLKNTPKNALAISYQCAAFFHVGKYEDAIDKCDRALLVDGNWGDASPSFALMYKGLALRKSGRLENALLSYNRGLAIKPSDSFIKAERCSLIASMGEASPEKDCSLKSAIQEYELAAASDSRNPIVSIQQGLTLEQAGMFERASTAYAQAIQLEPQNSFVLARRCGVLGALEDYKAALEACDSALANIHQLDKFTITYLLTQRSGVLAGLEKYEEALASADRAIAINPDFAYAYTARAVSLWGLKDFIEARKVSRQAVSIFQQNKNKDIFREIFARKSPDTPVDFYRGLFLARYNQGRILASTVFAQSNKYKSESLNAYQEALKSFKDYRRALKIDNEYLESNLTTFDKRILTNLYANQSAAHLRLNSYQEALNMAEKATSINQNSFAGWYNKALALSKLNEDDKALEAYDKADKLSPNNKYVLTGKGLILQKKQRFADALSAFDKVLGLEPDNIPIVALKGAALQKMGRFQEAVTIYDLVLGNEPKNLKIIMAKGLALQGLLKFDEAIAIYEQAQAIYDENFLSKKSNSVDIFNILTAKATALENLGKKQEAIALYKKVLGMNPNYAPAKERLEFLKKPDIKKPDVKKPDVKKPD